MTDPTANAADVTWTDLVDAVMCEVVKLLPSESAEWWSADMTFLTTTQDLRDAIEMGIAAFCAARWPGEEPVWREPAAQPAHGSEG